MSDLSLPIADPPQAPEGSRFAKAHHILLYFLGLALLVWLLSGVYQVRTDQVAIVERLGQYVSTSDGHAIHVRQGLHYHLPWPIDRVHILSIQQNFTMNVTAFNTPPSEYADLETEFFRDQNNQYMGMTRELVSAIFDPYLITADKSVVKMQIGVQFLVRDPEAWLTSISHEYHEIYDPADNADMRNSLFQQIAQKVLVTQASKMSFEDLLLQRRQELPEAIRTALQDAMRLRDPSDPTGKKQIDLGVEILRVEVSVVRPPDAIRPAFENVLAQRSQRDTVQSNAESDANSRITKATGERQTLVTEADIYKQTAIQAAKGEADRFQQVLSQYYKAPDVTRWNLYVDAVRSVTSNVKRIVFALKGQRTYIEVDPPQYDARQVNTPPG